MGKHTLRAPFAATWLLFLCERLIYAATRNGCVFIFMCHTHTLFEQLNLYFYAMDIVQWALAAWDGLARQ